MDNFIAAGYPFELAGLVYYVYYLMMSRGKRAAQFSQRSKILTLVASFVLVGSVPLHYAQIPIAIIIMLAVGGVALWSTYQDRQRTREG